MTFIPMNGFCMKEFKDIAVVLIATNNYIDYAFNLIPSVLEHNKNNNYVFFVFTNKSEKELLENFKNVEVVPWDHKPWPLITLFRYKAIVSIGEKLKKFDYVIYLDVDMQVNCDLENLLQNKLFAVKHPGFRNKPVKKFPIETNLKSTAFIERNKVVSYFCGGVQGGRSEIYLRACRELEKAVNFDFKNEFIAKWHDESHWNRYVNENIDKFHIYNSEYCWPEEWSSKKYPGKILALQKMPNKFRRVKNIDKIIFYLRHFYDKTRTYLWPQRY